jgi:hypothetical protein
LLKKLAGDRRAGLASTTRGRSKVEREAAAQVENKISDEITRRFPDVPVKRVAVLQYGDDPVVEPGEVVVRIVLDVPPEDKEAGRQAVEAFHRDHREAFQKFREDVAASLPDARVMEILTETDGRDHGPHMRLLLKVAKGEDRPFAPGELTPVMARLGPADLETLDTLITAGIAPNRAEAVRWVLARIRERPAYGQLRERARAIEELKAQF